MIWRDICFCFEVLFEEVVQFLLLDQGQGVDLSAECLSIWDKFNGGVPLLPVQELIKRLLGKDILELLVGFRHYVLEVYQTSLSCSL